MTATSAGLVARPMLGAAAAAEMAMAVDRLICGKARSMVSLLQ
jgi:hypothetical protein